MEAATDLETAVAAVDASLAHLLSLLRDRALAGENVSAVLDFAGWSERTRNRWSQIDHQIVVDLETKNAASERLMRSTAHLLADTLRIGRGEARRRVEAAEALAEHDRISGGVQPPRYELLAEAEAAGAVSAGHTAVILRCLTDVEGLVGLGTVSPADVEGVERTLTGQADVFDPLQLSKCAVHIIECLDPDGAPDRDERHRRLRRLSLRRMHGGMWRISGDLLPETGSVLSAVLRPLAAPRLDNAAEGRLHESDPRTPDERLHDAIDDAARRLLATEGLPATGGVPATVIVTIDHRDLLNRTGLGHTSDGAQLSVATVLRLAEEAEIIPAVLNDAGGVLSVGRSRRIATRSQTLALIARDGGCSFPGCDHPPQWCDRHHIRAWVDGGETDLDNLTLLCSYHHYRFESHGWSCRLIDGLPHWTAPPHLDPDQTPQLNRRLDRARYTTAS